MATPKTHFNNIIKFYYRKKRMPSYREIMQLTGFKSTNAVHRLVEKMVGEGLVEKEKSGRLVPRRPFFALPLLGTVEAGFPTHVEEELAEALSLDEFLIRNREATYVLVVSGDSMKDAGIMPGDMVLVERGSPARNGDIVIAEV
ncbi:MAG: S24 family peptidase, partial [bacterium]|nr:S24 family peptidase [bacterium]MDZ4296092.1 S24 family peptidase [Patescibacteria group bacterium]